MTTGGTIEPDRKDWTWVLQRPCPECGFESAALDRDALPDLVRGTATRWRRALGQGDSGVRPAGNIWSPLEYACHVRDVHQVFDERVRRMLTEDDPAFDNWDQDATAVRERYHEQAPATVADELATAAERVAERYAGVTGDQWERTGRRSDGSVFTVDSIARYHLHDVLHHLHDVGT